MKRYFKTVRHVDLFYEFVNGFHVFTSPSDFGLYVADRSREMAEGAIERAIAALENEVKPVAARNNAAN